MDYYKQQQNYIEIYNNKEKIYQKLLKKYNKDILRFFTKENIKILEIGFGIGKFANFCQKHNFDYTGIDIDGYFIKELKKDFPNFSFIETRFQDYYKYHENEYDIIFLSHVFEHLNEKERKECIKAIYKMLKNDGKWINIMPNADCDLKMFMGRYGDITHYTIYNHTSFCQLIRKEQTFQKIESYNTYVGITSIIDRLVHKVFLYMTKIYYLGMGFGFPKIYTREFITVLYKKQ